MCQWKSAIVTRQGELLHHWNVDSHENLVSLFDLKDKNDYFVRVEFTPTDNKYADVTAYVLRVDEQSTPAWFEDFRESVTEKLRGIISKAIITGDRRIIVEGEWILAGEAKLERLCGGRVIRMLGSSQVGKMLGSSQVGKMLGSSQVGKMLGSSQVGEMLGSSQVGEMLDSSRVGEMLGSSQVGEMLDSSRVGEMLDSSRVGEMLGSSQVGKMLGSSRITLDKRVKK
jgi:hypothetical protein